MIPKANLKHGSYYNGRCRNATIARWDEHQQHFVYWREKFGARFLEEIKHPDDDQAFDTFIPLSEAQPPRGEIRITGAL